jgi:hypothetical protein
MQTLFKSYYCRHPENSFNGKNMQVPNDCPMSKTQPDKFCVGCEHLEVKTELI